jgi:hypothetical protein
LLQGMSAATLGLSKKARENPNRNYQLPGSAQSRSRGAIRNVIWGKRDSWET